MGKRRGRSNAAPEVEPLDVDGVRTVAVVTVFWAAAFVVLAFFREQLVDEGYGWWLWTCLAGVGLGLLALEYTRKRRDAILEAEARTATYDDEFDDDEDVDAVVVDSLAVTEDRKPTGPITTSPPVDDQRPTGPIAAAGTGELPMPEFGQTDHGVTDHGVTDHGAPDRDQPVHGQPDRGQPDHDDTGSGDADLAETDHGRSGRGGRRKSRRGKGRGKGSGTRSDAASLPLDDTAVTTTNPGASSPVSIPESATPAAPAPTPRTRRSGHHVEPEPEFDTDVRAWLQLSEADSAGTGDAGAGVPGPQTPAADPDANVTRPIPTRPPPRSSRPPVGRGGAVRPTPDATESGELPPSTPRSAPYPGDARRRPASPPPAASPPVAATPPPTATPPPASPPAKPATTSRAKPATTPPAKHGGPLPRRGRSQGPSADSEFFEPIRPAESASGGGADLDPDAPLIETTLGGTRRRRQPVEEPEAPGRTGTEGPYRGRRARRSDSG